MAKEKPTKTPRTAADESKAGDARFRTYFDLGLIGMAITSPVKGWVEVNDKLCEILGYSREELVEMTWAELTHPDDLAADVEQFNRVLAGEVDGYSMEKRFVRQNGSVADASIDVRCLRNEDGSVDQFVAMIQDVSERKRAERELQQSHDELERRVAQRTNDLRESEQRFRSIFEQAAIGMTVLETATGRFIRGNQMYCDLLGYTNDELLRSTFQQVTHPDDLQEDLDNMQRLVRGEIREFTMEKRYFRKDGSMVWANLTVSALWDAGEEPKYHVAIIEDISDRKRAEAGLLESEQRFRGTFEQAAVGIAQVALDGHFVRVNQKLCDILGYDSDELLARSFQEITHPEHLEESLLQTQKVLDGKLSACRVEKRYLRKDWAFVWGDLNLAMVRDEAGDPKHFIAVVEDINDRKQAEEQLRTEQKLLRRLIEIQEQERRMVAHDIHDGFVQDVVGAHMQVQCIEGRRDGNESAAKNIGSLLEKAIAEGRRLIRDLRPMILDESGVVEAIRHLLAEEQATEELAVAFDHDVKFERLEPRLEGVIFRIVQEALTNVRRHARTGHAAVQMAQQNGILKVVVRDQGVGFDPQSVSPESFGLRGICERARLFGGEAEIESVPGEGTVIRVTLPITSND